MHLSLLALLMISLALPVGALAQKTSRQQMVYYDAKNRPLPFPLGAVYAVKTEYIDSLRATETWYSGPQKIKEIISFSNVKRRERDGETLAFYDDGTVKRRIVYRNSSLLERVSYYPSHKISRRVRAERDSVVEDKCYDEAGLLIHCDTLAKRMTCPNGQPRQCTVQGVALYPAKALKAGAEGKVTVRFAVNRFGELVDVWVVASPSALLNEAAVAAVRRMKEYCPQYIDCEPMDVLYTWTITFEIK